MIFESSNSRLSVSFAAVFSLYVIGFWLMHLSSISVSQKMKIITNVEFLKIEKPVAPVIKAPEPENTRIAPPAPALNGKALPAKTNAQMPLLDTPIEPVKKVAPKISAKGPELLEEKREPIHKLPTARIEELKRERDAKISDLMDMTKNKGERVQKLITQEQTLTERSAPLQRQKAAPALEEVGVQRVATSKLTDIAQPAATVRKTESLQDTPRDASPLIEKKRLLKMQLAALGTQSTPQPPAADAKATPRRDNITDISGSLKERQKAKEIVELQKIIDTQEPAAARSAKPAKSNFEAITNNSANTLKTRETALKELPVENKVPEIPIKKLRVNEGKETVQEIKKSALEITGPLKQRKLISSSAPQYPEWARRKGIEADVQLKFYVNPQGRVTTDITIARTSGYRELDLLSIEALKKWIFAPLNNTEPQQDQWGAVTIRYILE